MSQFNRNADFYRRLIAYLTTTSLNENPEDVASALGLADPLDLDTEVESAARLGEQSLRRTLRAQGRA